MKFEDWKTVLEKEISLMSRKDKMSDSLEEIYCVLFDDLIIEKFLQSKELNENARQAGISFVDAMNNFKIPSDQTGILGDPRWQAIQDRAVEFLRCLRRH